MATKAELKLKRGLKREAAKKGLTGERAEAYVWGTMRKTGWKPEREKHHRGGRK